MLLELVFICSNSRPSSDPDDI